MSKVLLEKWQSLELFSRIVWKSGILNESNSVLADFYDLDFLNKKLNLYDNKTLCRHLSFQIFGERLDENGVVVKIYPSGFYEFGRKIRLGEPLLIDEEMLDCMLAFVNNGLTKNDRNIYLIRNRRRIVSWEPSEKQSQLQQTYWWLYYYDRKFAGQRGRSAFEDGVTKALLIFHPFGKVELFNYSPNGEKLEEYLGSYNTYGKDEKHLSLEMKLKSTGEKDLHMLFYIGTDLITLALGQYHNIGRSIYSGTVMIEQNTKDWNNLSIEDMVAQNVKFFPSGSPLSDIPDHVAKYFEERKRNLIRTPCTITDLSEFKRWHDRKNKSLDL